MGSITNSVLLSQLIPGLAISQMLFWLAILAPIVLLLAIAVTSVFAFDVAKKIVSTINEIFQQIKNVVTPPKDRWDSWQVLIWISVFSWVTSMLPRNQIIHSFIATVGWLFLIPGVHWFMHEENLQAAPDLKINVKKSLTIYNFYFAPWITGALVCIFLFGSLTEGPISVALVCWPPISTIIAILPKFIKLGPKYAIPEKPEDRQQIILLMLSNLLLSSWIGLYFSTQDWLEQYPSILSSDLSRSAVVIDLNPRDKPPPRGVTLLERMGELITEELQGRSWSQVERWLFELDQRMPEMRQEVFNQLPELEENRLWELEARPVPGTEYALQLFAVWLGPTPDGAGYYLTKTCMISKTPGNRVSPDEAAPPSATAGLAQVECGNVNGPFPGRPDYSRIRIDPDMVPKPEPDSTPASEAESQAPPPADPESDKGNKSW